MSREGYVQWEPTSVECDNVYSNGEGQRGRKAKKSVKVTRKGLMGIHKSAGCRRREICLLIMWVYNLRDLQRAGSGLLHSDRRDDEDATHDIILC